MQFLILNVIIFVVALAGGLFPLLHKQVQQWTPHAVSFAAGVLLGAAALYILPESYEILNWPAFLVTAAGFSLFYFPQKIISRDPAKKDHYKKWGYLAFAGITLHSLTDGLGVGAAGEGDSILHVVFGVAAHKLPASIALSVLLIAASFNKRQTAWMIFLFALSTPAGAFIIKSFVSQNNSLLQGYALAFSGGNFLAVIFSDITQKIQQKNKAALFWRITLFALGFLANTLHLHH